MPRRSPPPPPSSEAPRKASSASNNSKTGESTAPFGAFWATQHAKDSECLDDKTGPKYEEDSTGHRPSTNLFPDNLSPHVERLKQPKADAKPRFHDDAFNSFVADFDVNKQSPGISHQKPEKEEMLEAELEKMKEQLANVNAEKAEITSKFEKLSAICRSQRQEIQDLKNALAVRSPSPGGDSSRNLPSPPSRSPTIPPVFSSPTLIINFFFPFLVTYSCDYYYDRMRKLKGQCGNFNRASLTKALRAQTLNNGRPSLMNPSHRQSQQTTFLNLLELETVSRKIRLLKGIQVPITGVLELRVLRWFPVLALR